MTQSAPADGRLTDVRYWENVWQNKGTRQWTDLRWIRGRYHWVAWDRILRARLRRDPSLEFLEIGCGTGKWLVYFHHVFGYRVTGNDYSDRGCTDTRQTLARAGIEGRVIQADCFDLTGEYDVICSLGLIEHFEDTRAVLAKFASLLRPGGTLISVVPNLTGLSGAYHRLLKPETFTTHRIITLADLEGWYGGLGLARLQTGALGSIVPMRLPRDVLRKRWPRLYRGLWHAVLRPLMWGTNKACATALVRWGVRLESQRFSPYLYAIGERP
jgi:SAM-dependent methyltransferase